MLMLAMSTGIEVWQAFNATGRSSDVTDILTNTTGGVLGFAIGRGCRWAATAVGRRTADDPLAQPSGTL
jgi:VanZ family protein